MTNTTLSTQEFIQNASEAKMAAEYGPVFIVDQGQPTHVLMTFEAYQRLTEKRRNIADALAMPNIVDVDFDPRQVIIEVRQAEF
jgi:PHD/YefM family antitoxin component YafN of YafNO toxin-antitoxin module